jgi:hypothetical protein
VLDCRQERAERRREHLAELNQRAAEADVRLKRLYDAIESGVAELDDPALKDRIAGLKSTRDQAQADAERTVAALESAGQQTVTPAMVRKFAATARARIRITGGGYRRDHLRALAQRVEVAGGEVRIMGSKSDLLRTLAAAAGVKSALTHVRSSVPKWRPVREGILSPPIALKLLADMGFFHKCWPKRWSNCARRPRAETKGLAIPAADELTSQSLGFRRKIELSVTLQLHCIV